MRKHGKRGILAKLLCDEALAVRDTPRPRTNLTFKAASRSYLWSSDRTRVFAFR